MGGTRRPPRTAATGVHCRPSGKCVVRESVRVTATFVDESEAEPSKEDAGNGDGAGEESFLHRDSVHSSSESGVGCEESVLQQQLPEAAPLGSSGAYSIGGGLRRSERYSHQSTVVKTPTAGQQLVPRPPTGQRRHQSATRQPPHQRRSSARPVSRGGGCRRSRLEEEVLAARKAAVDRKRFIMSALFRHSYQQEVRVERTVHCGNRTRASTLEDDWSATASVLDAGCSLQEDSLASPTTMTSPGLPPELSTDVPE
eukprot:TRINITY_DN15909_c0_g1_i1.p1 TRINITY_DN15909_c0_g1~~TRINITY_DN15909_c0_g1_i1.p1  ORF type:complete len:256 (-),score=37.16 TRINITY_DN15909_c0_g1_i1:298-1065(-)